jgi:hypothetical protein
MRANGPSRLLSHQAKAFVAEFRRVKGRLTGRNLDDDSCRLFPIGDGPQIKLGNDGGGCKGGGRSCRVMRLTATARKL